MAKISTVAGIEPHTDIYTAPTPKPAIKVPGSSRFLYFHRPDRVAVMHGQVLPSLAKLIIEPGVNLVSPTGDVAAAVQERRRRGWFLLEPDVDGPGTSYAVKRYNHVGAAVWLDQHEVVHYGSDIIGDGSKPYAEWLGALMADGKVTPPHDYIVEGLMAELKAAADVLIDRDNRSEAGELRALKSNIKACEVFLASIAAELVPAPPEPVARKRKAAK
jgi:hypothetical protein